MNILGCLDRPTRGTYQLAGLDVGARSNDGRALVRNRLIGFIFQGFNLLPRTTALENVELPLTYRGVSGKERRRRATAALEAVAAPAELPPVGAGGVGAAQEALDPLEAARQRLGGPVPFGVYATMFGGLLLGAVLGVVYDAAVLGETGPVIPALAGLAGEAW